MISCLSCHAAMRTVEVGAVMIEAGGDPPQPITIRSADILRCPSCGTEIGVGAAQPFTTDPVKTLAKIVTIGKARVVYITREAHRGSDHAQG